MFKKIANIFLDNSVSALSALAAFILILANDAAHSSTIGTSILTSVLFGAIATHFINNVNKYKTPSWGLIVLIIFTVIVIVYSISFGLKFCVLNILSLVVATSIFNIVFHIDVKNNDFQEKNVVNNKIDNSNEVKEIKTKDIEEVSINKDKEISNLENIDKTKEPEESKEVSEEVMPSRKRIKKKIKNTETVMKDNVDAIKDNVEQNIENNKEEASKKEINKNDNEQIQKKEENIEKKPSQPEKLINTKEGPDNKEETNKIEKIKKFKNKIHIKKKKQTVSYPDRDISQKVEDSDIRKDLPSLHELEERRRLEREEAEKAKTENEHER